MQTSSPKNGEKTAAGATLLLGSAIAFGISAPVGAIVGAASCYYMQRKRFGIVECLLASTAVLKESFDDLTSRFSSPDKTHSGEVVSAVLSQIPIVKHFELQLREQLDADGEWLENLVKTNPRTERLRSFGVLGEPGDGKSWLLKFAILRFMERYPKGRVYIHDMELRKTIDKWGEDGAWFGLKPGEVVYETVDELEKLVNQIWRELDKPTDEVPILLVVDELNNVLDQFSNKRKTNLVKRLEDIKNRGGKRDIQFAIATQVLDVEGAGISQAFIRALDWVVLRTAAKVGQIHRNMGLRDSQKKQFDGLVDDLEALPNSDDFYPCITYIGKELQLNAVPDLGWMPRSLKITSPEAEAASWLETILTNNPDILAKVQDGMITSRTQLANALDPILRATGEPLMKRAKTDDRWVEIGKKWSSLITGEFPQENATHLERTELVDRALPHDAEVSAIADLESVPN